jgi:F-type H+-transporting ATPase subunit epsilon
MKEFHLEILTPDGRAFEGMVESLLVHAIDGDVEFLAGHVDYLTSLGIGRARIKIAGKDRYASVSGGFVTVTSGDVKLIATTFEFAENIDIDRARAAKEKAKEILASSKDSKTIELTRLKLQRALSRINVSELK